MILFLLVSNLYISFELCFGQKSQFIIKKVYFSKGKTENAIIKFQILNRVFCKLSLDFIVPFFRYIVNK